MPKKPKVKIAKFEGDKHTGRTANILVDGRNVGWIEPIMEGRWASASSRQTIETVSYYSVSLKDERISEGEGDQHDFATRGAARAFVEKMVEKYGQLEAYE